jgi:N-acetylmuramoyl-L-alanine amidase
LCLIPLLLGLGSWTNKEEAVNNPNVKNWVVVIDAGHGGRDPGSIGRRSKEKDITLSLALKTGRYIEDKIDGVKVIYTREKDEFIELYKRAEIANKAKADLFISIHCNGLSDKRVRGSETFAMGIHKDAGNLEVAMAENSVITLEDDYTTRYQGYDPNSSESFIAFSLMQNIYLEQSLNFASFVQSQFRDRVGLRDRGVKQAGFIVLWQTTMPSVLVEAGFISNIEEEKFLTSEKGQDYVASAIFRAFRDYKLSIDQKSDFSTIKQEANTEHLNDKIDFRVQLSTSSVRREVTSENFNMLPEISEISAGRYYKYASGHFESYGEAAEHRKTVQKNYPDAFVIAVKNQKIVPLQEAIELTKKQ